ncbi:transcription initiation factor IIB [Halopelagius longus]|uniref:Transcription initiation factor IIB n=1 Tax=Halopelagius longus TaxID=1236180 RepID=A0A1H1C3N5_9EURY|nr:transcription initiation factor IIB [Halopelagius longus]RDI71047.1 transcription initiation factor IIB 2 [Halopelagius longus]SDQ58640.1 Transcription initiation factor IIB (TFIIB) [Halopelagius longus]
MSDTSSVTAHRRGETDETRTERPERRDGDEKLRCPECASSALVADEEHGETVCDDCGLVVEEDSVDRGPEWRAFDAAERDEKSRVGAPTTNTMHDKGLSTNIGRENRDSKGNSLSSRQRKRMHRLRTWNERFRTRDSKERNLKQALGEIDRMASALGLPENVRETASVIYRRALDDGLLPGRSIEGIATASLYAAARMAHVPRSLDELARVSRVDEREFQGAYRYVVRELALEIEPADPTEYLPRFASELDVPAETERTARELLEDAKEANLHSGKSPVGLAAAALYAAVRLTNVHVTQTMIADVSDISEVTIRNRYQELLDAREESAFDGPNPAPQSL